MTTQDSRPANVPAVPIGDPLAGTGTLSGHITGGTHAGSVAEGQDSPQAKVAPAPRVAAPAGNGAAPPAIVDTAARHEALEGRQDSQGHVTCGTQARAALADDIPGGQGSDGAHPPRAAGEQDRLAAKHASPPIVGAPLASVIPGGQDRHDDQMLVAAGEQAPPAANLDAEPRPRAPLAGGDRPPPIVRPASMVAAAGAVTWEPFLSSPVLALYAEIVDDAEDSRVSNENRLRQFVRRDEAAWMPPGVCDPADKQVTQKLLKAVRAEADAARAEGRRIRLLPGWTPEVRDLAMLILSVQAAEHEATLALQRAMRGHPLWQWAAGITGVGEKQLARLLGLTGDPYVRGAVDHGDGTVSPPWPRTLGQWRAYCGHGDPARKPFKGMTQEQARGLGSLAAKMRAHLIAEKVIMFTGGEDRSRSPYRDVYEQARERYAGRVHVTECRNRSRVSPNGCGIRDHPEWGVPGSPWRDGHQHAAALRLVAKTFLGDLWREARRLHEEADG